MSDTVNAKLPCKHGRYETHPNVSYGSEPIEDNCPGGEVVELLEWRRMCYASDQYGLGNAQEVEDLMKLVLETPDEWVIPDE